MILIVDFTELDQALPYTEEMVMEVSKLDIVVTGEPVMAIYIPCPMAWTTMGR